jgi:hypothetical protein
MQRVQAVSNLKALADRQIEILRQMSMGDGRTTEFKRIQVGLAEKVDLLESHIQSELSKINQLSESFK